MSQYYEPMNKKFIKNKMAGGQLFEKWRKNIKVGSASGAAAFVVMGLFFLPMLLFSVYFLVIELITGDTGELGVAAVFALISLLFVGGMFCLAKWAWKRSRITGEKLMQIDAEHNSLSQGELLEFEQQASQPDSYILHFNLLDGIMTRDYLWLGIAGLPQTIIRQSDIIAMAAVRRTNVVGKKNSVTTFLYVISSQGDTIERGEIATAGYYAAPKPVTVLPDGTKVHRGLAAFVPSGGEEPAREVMKLLAKERSDIIVADRVLESGEEFDQWYERLWEV